LSRKVDLSRRARQQLLRALSWWYRHRDKAPNAFDEDLEETWELLINNPDVGSPVRSRRPGARRVLMERVRYYVYYRSHEDVIEVTAIWHASRRPPRL
jgi:plasmid stabilization system protein ParE